jgi:hypothetical protein
MVAHALPGLEPAGATRAKAPPSILALFLALGALCAPFSWFALPIPGGATKPLIAICWFPVAFVAVARMLATRRCNVVELVALAFVITAALWFPVLAARGSDADLVEYIVRLAALASSLTVAIVASNIEDPRTFRNVLRLVLTGYLVILLYGFFVQIPGVLGFGPAYALDVALRSIVLNRSLSLDRIQLLADEPSFAAYQGAAAVLIAITFRAMAPRRLARAVIGLGIVDLIFMKSVTALAMLCFIMAALVLSLRDPRLKVVIILVMTTVLGVGLAVLVQAPVAYDYDPLARVSDLSSDKSANVRYYLAKSTVDAGLDAGILGLGPGQYSRVSEQYIEQDPETLKRLTGDLADKLAANNVERKPFSLLGGIFAEFGALCLALTLVMIFYPTWTAVFARLPNRGVVFVACCAIVTAYLGAVPLALPDLWLLLGLLVAMTRGASALERAPTRRVRS